MKKTTVKDMEHGEELTFQELHEEYEALKKAGKTEAQCFEDYMENITDKTGTCQWCGERFSESELQEEVDLGFLCRWCIAGITSRGEKISLKH